MITYLKKILFLLDKKEKYKFFKLSFFMFFASILETIGIASIFPLINFFIGKGTSLSFLTNITDKISFLNENNIISLVAIVFVIYLFKNLYLSIFYWFENAFAYNTRYNLGSRLYQNYLSKSYDFHIENNSSVLITKIVQQTAQFGSALMSLSAIITEFFVVLGITILLLFLKTFETLCVISIILIIGILFYSISKKISHSLGKSLVLAQKQKMKILNESLKSVKEIIIFRVKNYFSKTFREKSMRVSTLGYKMSFVNKLPRVWFEMAALIIICFIILYSTLIDETSTEILATLGIFLVSALKIIPSIVKILVSLQTLKFSEPSIQSLCNDLDHIQEDSIENLEFKNEIKFEKNILFDDVEYKFDKTKRKILTKLNFKILPKEFIAIIGPTGTGKTTFLNLIMGLLEVSSGKIIVDGKNIKNNLFNWRKKIGFVPQNIYLLDDTIKKNIAFGIDDKEINENNIRRSIFDAQLNNFINESEKKYETKIGEDGKQISGGQKQRIAIARALYHDPEILILDEPSSSLDSLTSDELFKTLKKLSKNKTIILVSHNIEDYEIFDRVYEIKNQTLMEKK
tara:strand:+ start:187 stop:1905 length:1719 start_codon:yes stop_codon:yes gene_type:complete